MIDRIPQDGIHPLIKRRHSGLPLRGLRTGIFIVTVFTVVTSVGADEPDTEVIAATPGTSYSRTVSSGWQGATRRNEAHDKMPRPKSSLTIRAYEGFEKLRPYYGDEPAYGIDITAEIEKCPDGDERISTLNIGGWLYEVDGDCSNYRLRKRVSESQASGENSQEKSGEAEMRCDPATWRCRIVAD
jgi:hypothetical protein